jgi:hypothetical protein
MSSPVGVGNRSNYGSAWAWHLGDRLGSVRQLVDDRGRVTLAPGYMPFGVPLSATLLL